MSIVTRQVYEPDPRQHISVYALSVDFAEEQICLAPLQYKSSSTPKSVMAREDPMVGKMVLVVKDNFRGYYGTIQYTHRALEFFGVRLDSNGKIVQLREDFLVDRW